MKNDAALGERKAQTEPSGSQNDQEKRAQVEEEVAQVQRRIDGGAKRSRHDDEQVRGER